MAGRRDHDIGVRPDRRLRNGQVGGRPARQRDLDIVRSSAQPIVSSRLPMRKRNSSFGWRCDEGGDQPRREIFCGRDHADRKPPALPGLRPPPSLRRIRAPPARRPTPCSRATWPAGLSRRPSRRPVEQRHADRALEALQPRGQRGRRHVESRGGGDQRARLGDRLQRLRVAAMSGCATACSRAHSKYF